MFKFHKATLLCVLGVFITSKSSAEITYTLDQSVIDSPIYEELRYNIQEAVASYNEFSDYDINIPFEYNTSVPTADASYQGTVRLGGSYSWATIIHEMAHILGIGTASGWEKLYDPNTNLYLGPEGQAAIKELEGEDAILYADRIHFWPHGFNYGEEDVYSHVRLIGAMRRDMGLPDRTIFPETPEGNPPSTNNYLHIQSVIQSGKNISASSSDLLAPAISANASEDIKQQWLFIAGDNGYFNIKNLGTDQCLEIDGSKQATSGDAVTQWDCHTGFNQQWQAISLFNQFYMLKNRASEMCIDLGFDADVDGALLMQMPCYFSLANQLFRSVAIDGNTQVSLPPLAQP